jgi:hypothetical protein
VKVTIKLAHAIANGLQVVVGYLDLALGEIGKPKAVTVALEKAQAAALVLAKLVRDQTVVTVENSEARQDDATLETRNEKK